MPSTRAEKLRDHNRQAGGTFLRVCYPLCRPRRLRAGDVAASPGPLIDQRGRGATSNTATQMAGNNDPNAPYKLYEGDKSIGTYLTRAEARRAQQKLESEAGSERPQFVIIKDKRGRIVL